jgi:mercuric ion transport protein
LATAAFTCPCHIPLILAILGGTALAVFLEKNFALALIGLTFVFLFALIGGLKLIGWERLRERRGHEVERSRSMQAKTP